MKRREDGEKKEGGRIERNGKKSMQNGGKNER